jgi:hypothetical protein
VLSRGERDDRADEPATRLVGIDLGIASDHTVRVLDERGGEVCRRRARPTVESLGLVEAGALAAKCIAGQDDAVRRRVEKALRGSS